MSKAETLLKRLQKGTLTTTDRDADVFWLGRASTSEDPEIQMALDLLLENQITLAEARDGAPLQGVKMVTYLQALDGTDDTPSSALATWRGLSDVARELLVERYDLEARRPGGELNPRRKPTAEDLRRLREGAEALALGEPTTPEEISRHRFVLYSAACAMQSLDDLGTDLANRRAHRDLDTLLARHAKLERQHEE